VAGSGTWMTVHT